MNTRSATTRAAGRLARRAFTVAEVEAMQRKGILHPDEKFELVEGEIVPMQSKSPVHELIKETLVRALLRACPDDLWIGIERTVFLSASTLLDPDVSLFRSQHKASRLDGSRMILAVEVAHTTLAYDRGLKSRLYARHGVPEYWVVDARHRQTIVHRGPRPDGSWDSVTVLDEDTPLTHPAVPGFSLRLREA